MPMQPLSPASLPHMRWHRHPPGVQAGRLAGIPEDVRSVQGDVRSVQGDVRSVQGDVQSVKGDVKILGEVVATLRDEVAAGFKALSLRGGGVDAFGGGEGVSR